jgi:hypothetical protein
LTILATGSCTVTVSSSSSGIDIVRAKMDILAGPTGAGFPAQASVHRETGDSKPGDSADGQKLWIITTVLDSSNNPIPLNGSVAGPITVHDILTLTPTAPFSVDGATVDFKLFQSGNCDPASTLVDSDLGKAIASGIATSKDTALNPSSDTTYSYRAHFNGNATFPAGDADCEPFTVTTNPTCPAGVFAPSIQGNGDLAVKYDQFPAPNDNSYGVNAVGWGTKGHTFSNLVGSDHAGVMLIDKNGNVVLDFKQDYITATTSANVPGISTVPPSGYASRGPFGGDGGIVVGTLTPYNPVTNTGDISWDSSLARNLNGPMTAGGTWSSPTYFSGGAQTVGTGVANLLTDSPPTADTTSSYVLNGAAAAAFKIANGGSLGGAGNPADSGETPGWNFHDTYFTTIKASKLNALGLNAALFVGPSKVGDHFVCPAPDGVHWCAQPNEDELHNSPAKPCPCVNQVDPNPTLDVQDNGNGTTTIKYLQSLAVNDNSYGAGTDPTWGTKSHTFSNLTGSDKAEFVITNGNGQTVNDFVIDYISAKPGTPSGYGSLGAGGGDGSLATGPAPLSWTTSLDDDMNILCPAGVWTTDSPTSPNAPECAAWNFVNSYTVTVSNSIFGASGLGSVTVPLVHNSPAKPTTCPGGTTNNPCNLAITKKEIKGKEVKITVKNNGTADAIISAIALNWPSATNGTLNQIKLDGDVIFKGPPISGGTANLTTAQLVTDQNKRKIKKGQADVIDFVFSKNADTNPANYASTVTFGPNCLLTVLP